MSAVERNRCDRFSKSPNEKSKTNLNSNYSYFTVMSKYRTTSTMYRTDSMFLQKNQQHPTRGERASEKLSTSEAYQLSHHSQHCQGSIVSHYTPSYRYTGKHRHVESLHRGIQTHRLILDQETALTLGAIDGVGVSKYWSRRRCIAGKQFSTNNNAVYEVGHRRVASLIGILL